MTRSAGWHARKDLEDSPAQQIGWLFIDLVNAPFSNKNARQGYGSFKLVPQKRRSYLILSLVKPQLKAKGVAIEGSRSFAGMMSDRRKPKQSQKSLCLCQLWFRSPDCLGSSSGFSGKKPMPTLIVSVYKIRSYIYFGLFKDVNSSDYIASNDRISN